MHWNYRVVFMEDDRWGDQWMELREVFYNGDGLPVGHSGTAVIGDNLDEVIKCLEKMLNEVRTQAVLRRTDFIGEFVDLDKER
jgi:hypothetical protein